VKKTVLSPRTWVVGSLALALPVLWYAGVRALMASGAETATLALSDFGEAALVALAAAFIIHAAYRFGWTEQAGRNWLLIGVGVALFALGDVLYGYYEVFTASGEVPYPGLPDIPYLLSYVFFAAALIGAAISYRRLVDERSAIVITSIITLASLVALYYAVFVPVLAATDATTGVKVLGVLYPAADVLLEFGPALFVALVVGKLGGGRLAWPWFIVALGIAITALSDAGYGVLAAHGLYESGSIVDIGWPLGYALVAVGAAGARDVFGV
jgi:diguanylate cyclase